MKTLTENLKNNTTGMVLSGIQMERTALSYPVPVMVNGVCADRYFLFVNVASALRSRPFAAVTFAAEDGRMLEYVDCGVSDFAKDSGISLNEKINYASAEKMNVRKLMEIKKEFLELYEEIRIFAFSETLSPQQMELLYRYSTCEKILLNPEMEVFYHLLSPEFYAWKHRMIEA